jgi:hypothetical protein
LRSDYPGDPGFVVIPAYLCSSGSIRGLYFDDDDDDVQFLFSVLLLSGTASLDGMNA